MGVPKKRHSKSKVGRRRMHIFLKEKGLIICSNCGAKILPHTVCPKCGYYKGREIFQPKRKIEKEGKEKGRKIEKV